MSLADLKLEDDVEVTETDSVGSSFSVLDSGVYELLIETAHLMESQSGATGLVLNAKVGNNHFSETFWIKSGKAKGCKPYYVNKNTGKKVPLIGYTMANHLTLLTVNKPIHEVSTQEKMIKQYDYEQKKEIPVKVEMLTELCGRTVTAGILKQIVDKTAKSDSGTYEPTGETKEVNVVDKLFNSSSNLTVKEIQSKVETPEFIETWKSKWAGKTRDRSTKTSTSPTPSTLAKAAPSPFA